MSINWQNETAWKVLDVFVDDDNMDCQLTLEEKEEKKVRKGNILNSISKIQFLGLFPFLTCQLILPSRSSQRTKNGKVAAAL